DDGAQVVARDLLAEERHLVDALHPFHQERLDGQVHGVSRRLGTVVRNREDVMAAAGEQGGEEDLLDLLLKLREELFLREQAALEQNLTEALLRADFAQDVVELGTREHAVSV